LIIKKNKIITYSKIKYWDPIKGLTIIRKIKIKKDYNFSYADYNSYRIKNIKEIFKNSKILVFTIPYVEELKINNSNKLCVIKDTVIVL
jgi:hypothetical protein